MRKLYTLLLLFFLFGVSAFAQKMSIEGTVKTTKGESLPGSTVLIKGSSTGVTTDLNGKFGIQAMPKDILVISFIGFESKEIPVGNQRIIEITLIESAKELQDVVVTALGIERQAKSLGFSTQRVKGAEFVNTKDLNLANAMVGKVAGLEINASTEMLINSDIRLRGASPLIVVDGSPLNTTTWDLNYDDIESMDVLKGATASSLYGSAGINGSSTFGSSWVASPSGTFENYEFSIYGDFTPTPTPTPSPTPVPTPTPTQNPGLTTTTTAITFSPNPTNANSSITFTATVTSGVANFSVYLSDL